MKAAAIAPTTREQKSRMMGRAGYSISQNIYCPGLFRVTPPKGAPYSVDLNARTCNCADFTGPWHTGPCKHILWVELCRRFWMTLYRVPVTVRSRRFSAGHIAAFRALAPMLAIPAPEEAGERFSARTPAMIAMGF
jgi:hypothetical protein